MRDNGNLKDNQLIAAGLFAGMGGGQVRSLDRPQQHGGRDLCGVLLHAVIKIAGGRGPAVALSGGLDSSLILAMLATEGLRPVPYMLDDGACNPDEFESACRLCSCFGLEPVLVRVDQADLPGRFDDAVRACGGLIINARAVSKYLLFERIARKGGTVFSGAGADEVLFGDPGDALDPPRWHSRWRMNLEFAATMLKPAFRPLLPDFPGRANASAQSRLFRLSTETACLIIPIEMNIPRSLGLIPALPFLEPDFVSCALNMRESDLIRGDEGKAALRDCARRWLPDEMCAIPKRPVVIPASGMERPDRDEWERLFRTILVDSFFTRFDCFDREATSRCLDSYSNAVEPVLTMTERALMSACSIAILWGPHDKYKMLKMLWRFLGLFLPLQR